MGAIFRVSFVEVFEVYAHSPFPTGLIDQHHIGQPLRILDISDKSSLEELLHLFFCCLVSFNIKISLLLFYWLEGKVIIELMHHYFRVKSFHVIMRPSKDINISSEALREHIFAFGDELIPDLPNSVRL